MEQKPEAGLISEIAKGTPFATDPAYKVILGMLSGLELITREDMLVLRAIIEASKVRGYSIMSKPIASVLDNAVPAVLLIITHKIPDTSWSKIEEKLPVDYIKSAFVEKSIDEIRDILKESWGWHLVLLLYSLELITSNELTWIMESLCIIAYGHRHGQFPSIEDFSYASVLYPYSTVINLIPPKAKEIASIIKR